MSAVSVGVIYGSMKLAYLKVHLLCSSPHLRGLGLGLGNCAWVLVYFLISDSAIGSDGIHSWSGVHEYVRFLQAKAPKSALLSNANGRWKRQAGCGAVKTSHAKSSSRLFSYRFQNLKCPFEEFKFVWRKVLNFDKEMLISKSNQYANSHINAWYLNVEFKEFLENSGIRITISISIQLDLCKSSHTNWINKIVHHKWSVERIIIVITYMAHWSYQGGIFQKELQYDFFTFIRKSTISSIFYKIFLQNILIFLMI